jgi:hypothetical protein
MSKRQSLKGKGIDDLLFGLAENNKEMTKEKEKKKEPKPKSKVRKLLSPELEIDISGEVERLTVPLPFSQVQSLAQLERVIMKSRSRKAKKQRITKNSIIRACLQVFLQLDLDMNEISDENELIRRIEKAVK